ncbi:hypothetical protein G6O69_13055 [Pseudenhygromyxa sp. WMMC2535]|uniref:hypothetical protein n=1 Tax=Pseudenhygromyxa sp. WMMC2535 TaxID=2712867 RepID=UPI0015579698|nr:hypothetical protein [Pseudenhygromyxa sp. WMMC2535]NVB38762.1 hypothetical protein [Pseudenhygromyxa sp. WMMC2535]
MRNLRRPTGPMWEIVERHFAEAEFMAELWRGAFDQPDMTLAELAGTTEARLRAHLEAVRLPGPQVLDRLFWPAVAGPYGSKALVGGLGILDLGNRTDWAWLGTTLEDCQAGDERWLGIVEAFALSRRRGFDRWLAGQLDENAGPRIAGLARALARRGAELDEGLDPLLASEDPAVLEAAATLARTGGPAQLARVAALERHGDPRVVCAAVETGLVRGLAGSVDAARHWAFGTSDQGFRRQALLWMALVGGERDLTTLLALLDDPEARPDALWAAGFTGRSEAVVAALPWLDDNAVGPLAGEAITSIVGLPMRDESLWLGSRPVDDELPALADEPTSLEFIPEELLPQPDPEGIRAWWARNEHRFNRETIYLAGSVLDGESLRRGLLEQPLRRRHTLALLAQLLTAGAASLASRSWARVQLEAIGRLRLP